MNQNAKKIKGISLTEGNPWKLILGFSIPVFMGIFLQQLYNTADTIIVGNYIGEAALSSVGTTACLISLMLAMSNGFSAGAGVILSQLFGAGEEQELRKNASASIVFLLLLGVATSVCGIVFSRWVITYILGTPEHLIAASCLYFRIYCLGMVFQFGYNIVASMLRAVGDSRASLYFLLISSGMNIAMDILFIAVFGLGVAGAAIATVLAQAASCIAAFVYMSVKYPAFRFKRQEYIWNTDVAKNVVRVGTPMALQQAIVFIGYILIQYAINSYGQVILATYTVGKRIDYFLNISCFALQTTMATYTAQNLGAGKLDRVKYGAMCSVILSIAITAGTAAVIYPSASTIVGSFGLSDEAAALCITYIRFASFSMIVMSSYYPILGVFQGSGDGFTATIVSTTALAIRVISLYALAGTAFFAVRIVWVHPLFGFIAAFIITWTRYLSGKWQYKKVIQK